MTHTPGPWTYTLDGRNAWVNGGSRVCTLSPTDQAHTNARLIAAAPELLQMLKNMVEGIVAAREAAHWSQEQKQVWLNGLVDAARAAIAKAEGANEA